MKTQNLRLITVISALLAVVLFSGAAWMQREKVVNKVIGQKLNTVMERSPTPGEKSRVTLSTFADGNPNIAGVIIGKVDFRMNTRNPTFIHFKDSAFRSEWQKFIDEKRTAPLFSANEVQNQRLISLINGQFVCSNFAENLAAIDFPDMVGKVQTLCSVPIPPSYGDFIGYISIFLSKEPGITEREQLELAGQKLALEIYERDVVKSDRRF